MDIKMFELYRSNQLFSDTTEDFDKSSFKCSKKCKGSNKSSDGRLKREGPYSLRNILSKTQDYYNDKVYTIVNNGN